MEGSVRSTPGKLWVLFWAPAGSYRPVAIFLPCCLISIGQTGQPCNNRYMDRTLMNTRQVAREAKVSIPTVTRWVQDGNLTPAFKGQGLRGGFIFERTEVERWLTERANKYMA